MINRESKYTAIYILAIMSLIIWSCTFMGIFNLPNGMLYDIFVKLTPKRQNISKQLLIIELDYQQQYNSDNDVWINTLDQLNHFGAKQILFSFFPSNASKEFYDKATKMGNVVFGRPMIENQDNNISFTPIPKQAQNINTAPYDLPSTSYGVFRFANTYLNIDDKKSPSFVISAALMQNKTLSPPPDDMFLINFAAAPEKLPNIDFAQLLKGNIVQELIKDRTVLIGFKKAINSPGMQTPTHLGNNSISLIEYQGYALYSLIEKKPVKWPNHFITIVFIVLIMSFGIVIYPLLIEKISLFYTISLLVLSLILTWISLIFLCFWPPLFEILISEGALAILISAKKCNLKNQIAKQVLFDKSLQIKERFFKTGFFVSQEYWSKVINMVNQTLNLERAIFLEKVDGDHRVKEVISLNTSIDDIQERRRDYERTPYSTAIEENRPIKVKSYFKTVKKSDEQYLVPLIFAGQVQGFWAFAVSASNSAEIAGMLSTIRTFALEIAEILYQRRKWQAEQKAKKNFFKRLLNLEIKDDTYNDVNNIIGQIGRRLSMMDNVFNSLEASIILYDIFGQVIHVNNSMSNILQKMDIAPFNMSALDLISKLTEYDTVEIRNMLSQTIINHDILDLPVAIPDHQKSFMLSIRPILGEEKSFMNDEAYPFDLHGILFEMMDVSEIKDLNILKSELFERSNNYLKNSVESLTNACVMIEDDKDLENHRDQLIDMLHIKKENLIKFMNDLNIYMSKDILSQSHHLFPISALKIIKDSILGLKKESDKQKISFEIMPKDFTDLVMANPGDLKKLCNALVSVLLQDAYDGTIIKIQTKVEDQIILYTFSNSGYGMPDEDFQRYLNSSHLTDSKEFKTISQISPKLKAWQADLTGKSDVGKGILFTLQLKKFQ